MSIKSEIRISRRLAKAGLASRREAEKLILDGRVTLNGKTVVEPWRNCTKKDLLKLRKFVEKNFDYVGENFPGEVRKVYYDKKRNKNIVILSRSHSRAKSEIEKANKMIFQRFNANKIIRSGSSIKLCYIAHGFANVYPRFGTTMEWDTAAGDAILRFAGGRIRTLDRKILRYGKKNFKNTSFIARS